MPCHMTFDPVQITDEDALDGATAFAVFTAALPDELRLAVADLNGAGADTVLAWAIATATRDFVSTTRLEGTNEEHRTSALMGFMATSMGVFSLLARMSNYDGQSRLLWHAANKRSSNVAGQGEDKTCGDFGIAVPMGADGGIRLSFLQAKNRRSAGFIDIRRIARPKQVAGQGVGRELHEAGERLLQWLDGADVFEEKAIDALNHQIFKLAAVQFRGNRATGHKAAGNRRSWVHYVVWSGVDPVCFTLDSVRAPYRGKTMSSTSFDETLKFGKAFGLIDEASLPTIPFASHLAAATSSEHLGWVDLSMKDAEKIVGRFVALGADWYICEDQTGSGGAELTRHLVTHGDIEAPVLLSAASRASAVDVTAEIDARSGPKHAIPRC